MERILELPEYKKARTVMLYRAVRGEADPAGLASGDRARGKRLVYPRCQDRETMVALEPLSENAWSRGYFGIPEPIPENSAEVDPEEIDLVICPCASFDEEGTRLGMGAGYYDRFLAGCGNAFILAIAFEVQKADHIPSDPWDYPMNMVCTEEKTYRF